LAESGCSGDSYVFEFSKFIRETDIIEDFAQTAKGHAKTVRATEASKLPTPFDVGFQVDKQARDTPGSESLEELRIVGHQVAEDRFVTRIA
jgi:hypothetical protein